MPQPQWCALRLVLLPRVSATCALRLVCCLLAVSMPAQGLYLYMYVFLMRQQATSSSPVQQQGSCINPCHVVCHAVYLACILQVCRRQSCFEVCMCWFGVVASACVFFDRPWGEAWSCARADGHICALLRVLWRSAFCIHLSAASPVLCVCVCVRVLVKGVC